MLFLMTEAVIHAESIKQSVNAKSQSDICSMQSLKGKRILSFRNPQTCRIHRIITALRLEVIGMGGADGKEYPQYPK